MSDRYHRDSMLLLKARNLATSLYNEFMKRDLVLVGPMGRGNPPEIVSKANETYKKKLEELSKHHSNLSMVDYGTLFSLVKDEIQKHRKSVLAEQPEVIHWKINEFFNDLLSEATVCKSICTKFVIDKALKEKIKLAQEFEKKTDSFWRSMD